MSWWTEYAPFITGAATITGALIGASVTYFLVIKRQTVFFVRSRSEDLTSPLHQNLQRISHKVGETEVLNLNRGMVYVSSRGNTSIKDFKFEITIQGMHDLVHAQVSSELNQLSSDVRVACRKSRTTTPADVIGVSLPFLNPNESFIVSVFFDGETVDCEVSFRMPDVRGIFLRVTDARGITPQVLDSTNVMYLLARLLGKSVF
jgi:hypothetical protein